MQSNDLEFKVNKQELCKRAVARLKEQVEQGKDIPNYKGKYFKAPDICDAIFDEIKDVVLEGGKVGITGFGSFYPMLHKGHPVQFNNKPLNMSDYYVFRFQVSHALNERLRSIRP